MKLMREALVPEENQKTISAWARKTFGEPTLEALRKKCAEEIDELGNAVAHNDSQAVLHECADCLVMLYQLANYFGQDLHTLVDEKMAANRDRTWKLHGDGIAQHIEEGP